MMHRLWMEVSQNQIQWHQRQSNEWRQMLQQSAKRHLFRRQRPRIWSHRHRLFKRQRQLIWLHQQSFSRLQLMRLTFLFRHKRRSIHPLSLTFQWKVTVSLQAKLLHRLLPLKWVKKRKSLIIVLNKLRLCSVVLCKAMKGRRRK